MKNMQYKQNIKRFLDRRAPQLKDRLQLTVFLTGIVMFLGGLPLHHLGVLGTKDVFMNLLSVLFWLASLGFLLVYIKRNTNLTHTIAAYGISAQAVQSVRIIYLSIVQPQGYGDAILMNQVIALTIVVYLIIAFVPKAPCIATAINLVAMLFALLCYTPSVPSQYVAISAYVEVFTSVLGAVSHRVVASLQRDNATYHYVEDSLLEAFNMSRQEFMAYVQLCRTNKPDGKNISQFFNQMDERSEANLLRAVEERRAERLSGRQQFAEHCPDLTPTELEVCRLIVAGKPLGEIARILNKSTNNISTVRIHIRRKLGLKTGDDLRSHLEKLCRKQ